MLSHFFALRFAVAETETMNESTELEDADDDDDSEVAEFRTNLESFNDEDSDEVDLAALEEAGEQGMEFTLHNELGASKKTLYQLQSKSHEKYV